MIRTGTTKRQPLDIATARVPLGRVHVIPQRCKGCNYCIAFCPMSVLTESTEINAKGYKYPVVAQGKEESCTHCQFCDLVCPEMAIFTEDENKVDEEEEEDGS